MRAGDEIEGLAEAFLAAHEAALRIGTPEMQSLTRILLHLVGSKLADQQIKKRSTEQSQDDS